MIGSNIKRSISIKKSTIGEITADHALLLWYAAYSNRKCNARSPSNKVYISNLCND